MRVLVTGDRHWTDKETIARELRELAPDYLIEGGAKGADSLAREVGEALPGCKVIECAADWGRYGRAAGPIRNKSMLAHEPNLVLAFHNNLRESKGTANMVAQARKAGIPVRVVGSNQRSRA